MSDAIHFCTVKMFVSQQRLFRFELFFPFIPLAFRHTAFVSHFLAVKVLKGFLRCSASCARRTTINLPRPHPCCFELIYLYNEQFLCLEMYFFLHEYSKC